LARKYVPNGKPNGGKRQGAGRPAGSKNTLELGEVRAIKAAGLRIPEHATEEQRNLADRAQQRIIDVMEEGVHYLSATSVLKAATHLREEICGAVKQKVEHSLNNLTDEELAAQYRAALAKVSKLSEGAGTTANAAQSKGDDASLGPNGEKREGDS
jgi:hypothetical protein